MNRVRIIALFIIFALTGCNVNSIGIQQDRAIDLDERNNVNQITQKLLIAIKNKDASLLRANLSKHLQLRDGSIDTLFQAIQMSDSPKLTLLSEFLVNNSPALEIKSVSSSIGTYKYSFHFQPAGLTTYIYLASIPDKNQQLEWLISLVYNKEPEWRLTSINIGPIYYKRRSAPQLYQLSKKALANQDIILANFYMNLVAGLSFPGGQYFHYELESEMQDFSKSHLQPEIEKTYSFPLTIQQLKHKPEILGSQLSLLQGQLYPKISYKTNLKLSDSNALQKENNQLHSIIENIFPGFKKLSDTILYDAVNSYDYSNSDHKEFIQLGNKDESVL